MMLQLGYKLALTLFLFSSFSPLALATPQADLAQEISDTVMSPFCPGRTLSACPSDDARKLRLQILDWTSAGQSEEQVREKLVSIYGEDVRGAPLAEGIGALAWYVPVLVGLAGILAVVCAVRVMSPKDAKTFDATIEPETDLMLKEKLDNEVKQRLI